MNFLDSNDIPYLIVIIASFITLCVQLAFIFTKQKRKAKKPIRIITSFSLLYVIFFYILVVIGETPFIGHGLIAAVGFILVIIPLIADTIADWRREK